MAHIQLPTKILRTLPKSFYHPIVIIFVIGSLLRLLYATQVTHVYYPDEIFQSIEQARRLVFGYGIIPWEFSYNTRSMLLPILTTPPLLITKVVSLNSLTTLIVQQVYMAILSSLSIIGVYLVAQKISLKVALHASLLWGLWYEAIYHSPRASSENMQWIMLSLLIISLSNKSKLSYWFSGLCILLLLIVRPQSILLIVPLAMLFKSEYAKISLATLILGGLFWLIESLYSIPIILPVFKYIYINSSTQIPAIFGTSHSFKYIEWIIYATWGLAIPSLMYKKARKYVAIFAVPSLIAFSLIPHKEYRFILSISPVIIIAIAHWLSKFKQSMRITTVLGICILIYHFFYANAAYQYPMSYINPLHHDLLSLASSSGVCGVYVPEHEWALTGGHTMLQQNVPIYSQFSPPPGNQYISHIVTSTAVEKVGTTCLRDDAYSSKRSFTQVEEYF